MGLRPLFVALLFQRAVSERLSVCTMAGAVRAGSGAQGHGKKQGGNEVVPTQRGWEWLP